MTNYEAVVKILGEESGLEHLKESQLGDSPCEFALLQISPRTPVYQAIEDEVVKQIEICGDLSVQMEAQCKGDPRALTMFCMETLRDCAKAVHTPDLLTQAYIRNALVAILGVLWVQSWRIRLATVQKVHGINRLISPFHNENGDKEA